MYRKLSIVARQLAKNGKRRSRACSIQTVTTGGRGREGGGGGPKSQRGDERRRDIVFGLSKKEDGRRGSGIARCVRRGQKDSTG